MKNQILKLSIIRFFVITHFSCNKEEQINNPNYNESSIKVDKNRIIFKSYVEYENLINDFQVSKEPQKFILEIRNKYKLQNSYIESHYPDSLQDEFLSSILNDNNIVQIGDYLYKVNLLTEKVYVLNTEYESEIIDLITENTTNEYVMEFSTGDDVIDLVEKLEGATTRGCGGIGGGSYRFPDTELGYVDGVKVTMTGGVKFFRAGIYFTLTGEVYYNPRSNALRDRVGTALHMASPGFWCKRKPCRNRDITIKNSGYVIKWQYDHTAVYRPYSGIRNLNGYHFFVRGRGTLIDENGNWYNTQNASAYGGRNISSPW